MHQYMLKHRIASKEPSDWLLPGKPIHLRVTRAQIYRNLCKNNDLNCLVVLYNLTAFIYIY